MRALALPLLFAALLSAPSPSHAQAARAAAKRQEAKTEVTRLMAGGSPQTAISRLQFLGEEKWASQELVRGFVRLTADDRRRNVAQVVAVLGASTSESFFIELTQSEDSALRMYGAQGLGRMRSKQVNALLPLLEDPSYGTRREAAKALGATKSKRAVRPLLTAAKTEGELEARQAMLVAVGRLGDKRAVKGLLTHLESSSESTRLAAGQALVLLDAPQGHAFAGKLLTSDDRFVRRQGVALYDGVSARQAKKHLEPMLDDSDKRVAAMAARTLYQGGDESKLEWLVLSSWHAPTSEKLHYEAELETLMVTDSQRRQILQKAGLP